MHALTRVCVCVWLCVHVCVCVSTSVWGSVHVPEKDVRSLELELVVDVSELPDMGAGNKPGFSVRAVSYRR